MMMMTVLTFRMIAAVALAVTLVYAANLVSNYHDPY